MSAVEPPEQLFLEALDWLRDNYEQQLFAERELVWTLQLRLLDQIEQMSLPHTVFHGHPMKPKPKCSADITILDAAYEVAVAVEFKYEPAHSRQDIGPGKFPVCFWEPEVARDVTRASMYVAEGLARIGYSVLIDEGGYFRSRKPHPQSKWVDWPNGVSVLLARSPNELSCRRQVAANEANPDAVCCFRVRDECR